jgi:ATP-dependent helicase/nuclease subunit A
LAQRAREALRDLETASISTFHSFAVSLLKERPVEAGLDPRFTALDEIRSELFFREVWELWISRALAERQPLLERALRNGFRMRDLEELARTLRHNRRAVLALQCDSPPTDDEIRERTGELLKRGSHFLGKALVSDKLVDHLEKALQWLRDRKELGRPAWKRRVRPELGRREKPCRQCGLLSGQQIFRFLQPAGTEALA